MATKLTAAITNPSDVYADEVLKCIRDTLKKKSGEICQRYDAAKAFARDHQTYVTTIADERREWKEKFERRKKNLTQGFFADKAKPYQSVGTVYLESGDLMLTSITSELRSKIAHVPKHFKATFQTTHTKKQGSLQKKHASFTAAIDKPLDLGEATAGYIALKNRLDEIDNLKKGVQADQSLCTSLRKKEDMLNHEEVLQKADSPSKRRWRALAHAEKLLGSRKNRDERGDLAGLAGNAALVAKAFRKSATKKLQKPVIHAELPDIEEKKEELERWRREVRQKYVVTKLRSINSLFCAIFNMKGKTLKSPHPLSCRVVKELLRSDVTFDAQGRPVSWKGHNYPGCDDPGNNSDSPSTPEAVVDGSKPVPQSPTVTRRKRTPSVAASKDNSRNHDQHDLLRQKLAQLSTKLASKAYSSTGSKIDTWEDLLTAGDKHKVPATNSIRPPTLGATGGKHQSRSSRRRPTVSVVSSGLFEGTPPWLIIAQCEKVIMDRKRIALQGNSSKRTAADILQDVRTDFAKLQKKLCSEMNEAIERQRLEQYKLANSKFLSIHLGPIPNIALEKMRSDAKALLKLRKGSLAKPLPWFVDLQHEVTSEPDIDADVINHELHRVARFQFESENTVPFAKEKLCILAMSMPIYQLLNEGMRDAILHLLHRVFAAPVELLDFWLSARKLDRIAGLRKSRKTSL